MTDPDPSLVALLESHGFHDVYNWSLPLHQLSPLSSDHQSLSARFPSGSVLHILSVLKIAAYDELNGFMSILPSLSKACLIQQPEALMQVKVLHHLSGEEGLPKKELGVQEEVLQYVVFSTMGPQRIELFYDRNYSHPLAETAHLYSLRTTDKHNYEIRLFVTSTAHQKRELLESLRIMSWYYWLVCSQGNSQTVNQIYQMRELQSDVLADI